MSLHGSWHPTGYDRTGFHVYEIYGYRDVFQSTPTAVTSILRGAGELLLFGLGTSSILYFLEKDLLIVFSALMPFLIISIIFFLYLGLTEKKRRKMGPLWEKRWIEYYSNPRTMVLRGTISGSLWIFSIVAFFIIAFSLGWQYSWLVFILAIGLEMVIETYFASKRKDD